ncbi:DoxX family protein [Acetobacteraceae bacterium H6797]|nr:DoxX family protein [Acetobacteraceae bacterium H6797]
MNDRLNAYGALLLRLSLGVMFIAHAWLKVSVFTVAGFEGYLTQVGLPAFLAWPIILTEILGGVALILGLYTRAIAVLTLPLLLGTVLVHAPNGWVFNAPNGGWEYPAFLAIGALVQALIGDGAYALKATPLPRLNDQVRVSAA